MDIQTGTVRTDGFEMDYFRFGRGDRKLVVLPGLSVESVMIYAPSAAQAYRPLAEDFTVWVFDRRKTLPESCSVEDMARDTAAALRTLGLERISLFGASQGGMIAMAMAAGDPGLAEKLALASTAALVDEERFRVIENWIRLALEGNAKDLYLAFGEAVYPPETYARYRDALALVAGQVTEADLKRFVTLAEGTRGFDIRDRLREIDCPVLVVGSADDRVLGAQPAEEIAGLLRDKPGLETYMYDGYGHAVYDTAPDFKERLHRFLMK